MKAWIRIFLILIVCAPCLMAMGIQEEYVDINEQSEMEGCLFPFFRNEVTCSQLGMIPNDYNSRDVNTKKLVSAINKGYHVICDNTFFIGGNKGDISKGIRISGNGTFIFDGTINIVKSIPYIVLDGVSFKSYNIYSGNAFDEKNLTVFYFPKKDNSRYEIKRISITNCDVNNVSLLRFHNRIGDHIKKVEIKGNTWSNMTYVGVAIGSTNIDNLAIVNNKATIVKSRLFDFSSSTEDMVKKALIQDNYLSNAGYFSNTTEFYAGLAVIECLECECRNNLMENFLVANEEVNLYDVYCNSRDYVCSNNIKHNVLNFSDANLLCKAKGFIGNNGSRIVENNSFVVDDEVIDKYRSLLSDKCEVRLMELMPNEQNQQSKLVIRNNVIDASVPCCFGMSNNTNIKDVLIQGNTIKCQSIAKGDYYYRGKTRNASISNNVIFSKDKKTSSTPAVSLLSGSYILEDCSLSAFPGAISQEVESTVNGCTLTFTYQEKASTHLVLGGSVTESSIDFQGIDLNNSYNIYLDKAKNSLSLSDLEMNNVPTKGTIWFRYILDAQRSAKFILAEFAKSNQKDVVLIDNVNHVIFTDNTSYSVTDSKQDIKHKTKVMESISFYGDRLGIVGMPEGMLLSLKEISEKEFAKRVKTK